MNVNVGYKIVSLLHVSLQVIIDLMKLGTIYNLRTIFHYRYYKLFVSIDTYTHTLSCFMLHSRNSALTVSNTHLSFLNETLQVFHI